MVVQITAQRKNALICSQLQLLLKLLFELLAISVSSITGYYLVQVHQVLQILCCAWLQVAPYEIFRIDKVEDSTTSHVLYEENVEESNQEIIEHEKQSHNHKGKVKSSSLSLSDAVLKQCSNFYGDSSGPGINV